MIMYSVHNYDELQTFNTTNFHHSFVFIQLAIIQYNLIYVIVINLYNIMCRKENEQQINTHVI